MEEKSQEHKYAVKLIRASDMLDSDGQTMLAVVTVLQTNSRLHACLRCLRHRFAVACTTANNRAFFRSADIQLIHLWEATRDLLIPSTLRRGS